jgi:hypothetical protein
MPENYLDGYVQTKVNELRYQLAQAVENDESSDSDSDSDSDDE